MKQLELQRKPRLAVECATAMEFHGPKKQTISLTVVRNSQCKFDASTIHATICIICSQNRIVLYHMILTTIIGNNRPVPHNGN